MPTAEVPATWKVEHYKYTVSAPIPCSKTQLLEILPKEWGGEFTVRLSWDVMELGHAL
jgi:hypothetical protein